MLLIFLSAVLAFESSFAEEEGNWRRQGLSIIWFKQTPLIDMSRIAAQKALGCGGLNRIRFGYTSQMREIGPAVSWTTGQRRLLSAAFLADNVSLSNKFVDAVLKPRDLDPLSRIIVENLKILNLLMFDDTQAAMTFLAQASDDADAPNSVRADRLFLEVAARWDTARYLEEFRTIDASLQTAIELDPSFFSVRAYRVAAWLKMVELGARPIISRGGGYCDAAVREFSDRVLDVSEASACPLLVGHFSHFLSRQLKDETADQPKLVAISAETEQAAWRLFALGILSDVSGNRRNVARVWRTLNGTQRFGRNELSCVDKIKHAMSGLSR